MKTRVNNVVHSFVIAALFFCAAPSQATPKAAEYEDAPVTAGIDVARPRIATKPAKQQVVVKVKSIKKKKHIKTIRRQNKPRALHRKK